MPGSKSNLLCRDGCLSQGLIVSMIKILNNKVTLSYRLVSEAQSWERQAFLDRLLVGQFRSHLPT